MTPAQPKPVLAGVFRCSAEQASALKREAEAQRYLTASIDLPSQVTPATLFEGFASALRFPEWFGANWDALADCLTDLSWLDESGYLITLRGYGRAFPAGSADAEMLQGVLEDACAYWQDEGTPFGVLVEDGPAALAELPTR
ncbi:barstar family protein [Niveibacterium sp. COAC-50]|uniref:barstar family protein n=1 Tax=Niveibacterium sp. COAC-50 TaxID=2729384 RepID=UPI0015521478|nr:barstar family protein [Niveibacterium sp. COAC-50]